MGFAFEPGMDPEKVNSAMRQCMVHYRWPPPTSTRTGGTVPTLSIQEQMGTDPMSKLAAAIERLCDTIAAPAASEVTC